MATTKDIGEWAEKAGYGATVRVPEGVYEIVNALIPAGRTIEAHGATFTIGDVGVGNRTIDLEDGVAWRGGHFTAEGLDLGGKYLEKVKSVPAGQEIDDATHCPAVFRIDTANDVTIKYATVHDFERAVSVIRSRGVILERLLIDGFFDGTAKVGADFKLNPLIKDWTRTTYAIFIQGGSVGTVRDVEVNNAGGAVVLGSAGLGLPEGWLIDRVYGKRFGDNGIYLSSGRNCDITQCVLDGSGGSMIKVRGYGHHVFRNNVSNGLDGIGVEGIGKTADAYGANGAGCTVENNVIENMKTVGIWTAENGEFFPRDVSIVGNYLKGAPKEIFPFGSATKCALSLRGGEGFTIERNTIEDCKGDVWLHLGQSMKTELKSYRIGPNVIRGTSKAIKIRDQLSPYVTASGMYLNE